MQLTLKVASHMPLRVHHLDASISQCLTVANLPTAHYLRQLGQGLNLTGKALMGLADIMTADTEGGREADEILRDKNVEHGPMSGQIK
jgi:hypothetical protein